jgi:acetylornithine deacetylase
MAGALSDRDLLARLVAFDSTSSESNLPLADFLCEYLDRPGVRIERQPAPVEPKVNLVVTVGPELDERRQGLVLSGHLDTVPAGGGWTTPPFLLSERDGALYGRGSADMKGFVALATNLAAESAKHVLESPLVLLFTYDEELGTLGARHFHDSWPAARPLPRQAVIGEPTELAVVRAHKGHLKGRYTIEGTSAHSAYPHLGHNAVEPAGRLIVALTALRRELEAERLPSSIDFPEVPYPALNVARVEGGTAINVVPERCVVEVGVRLLPGMDADALAARLQALAAEVLPSERVSWQPLSVSPPMELPPEAELFRTLCELAGPPAEPAVGYATDAGWLQRMGMECVVWGPGSIRVAHKPDEHLPVADLERARLLLTRLVDRCCAPSSPARGGAAA